MRASHFSFRALMVALALLASLSAPSRAQEVKASVTYDGVICVSGPVETKTVPSAEAIRTQAALDAFVARIPTKQITPMHPAPPSDDPLLKHPQVDFGRYTAVAVFALTVNDKPEMTRLERKGDGLIVTVKRTGPPDPDMMQRPLGIGRYQLVLVPHFSGAVVEVPAPEK